MHPLYLKTKNIKKSSVYFVLFNYTQIRTKYSIFVSFYLGFRFVYFVYSSISSTGSTSYSSRCWPLERKCGCFLTSFCLPHNLYKTSHFYLFPLPLLWQLCPQVSQKPPLCLPPRFAHISRLPLEWSLSGLLLQLDLRELTLRFSAFSYCIIQCFYTKIMVVSNLLLNPSG